MTRKYQPVLTKRKNWMLLVFAFMFFQPLPVIAADISQFDGKWKGKAYTKSGVCKYEFSFKLKVKKGIIKGYFYGQQGAHRLSGLVEENGVAEIALTNRETGRVSATLKGVFQGSKAEGNWTGAICAGTFISEKNN